jgi:hypothetical protein
MNHPKDKKNAKDISAILSPILGGIATVTGSIIEITALPAAGAIAGTLGIAGSIAGVYLGKGILPEKILELQSKGLIPSFPLFAWRAVRAQAERKLNSDFDNSPLSSRSSAILALQGAIGTMVKARLVMQNDPRLPKEELIDKITEASWIGLSAEKDLKILSKHGPISISCTAVPVAAIAVFRHINEKYHHKYGVSIEVVSNYLYGPDLVKAVNKDDRFDFIVTVDSPFYIAGKGEARKYRQLFPICWDANYAVRKSVPEAKITREILFCPESAAEEQILVAPATLAGARSTEVDFADLSTLVDRLDAGQAILSWDPIASTLAQHPYLEKEFGTEYRVWRSLYCHRKYNRNQTLLRAFVNVFVAEWNYYNYHRAEAANVVLSDKTLLAYFASAALNGRVPTLKRYLQE